jgi:hypothetical protein
VILLENKGIDDIANHLMEVNFTKKQESCWATNGISSVMKESVGFQFQFIFHIQLNTM